MHEFIDPLKPITVKWLHKGLWHVFKLSPEAYTFADLYSTILAIDKNFDDYLCYEDEIGNTYVFWTDLEMRSMLMYFNEITGNQNEVRIGTYSMNKKEEQNATSEKKHSHHAICDICQADPIRGFRYKCLTCDDFDICEKCEKLGEHSNHMMVRIQSNEMMADFVKRFNSGLKGAADIEMNDAKSTVEHCRIYCDNCNMSPIVGIRFKCIVCPDYDLCEKCTNSGVHSDHLMLRVTDPDLMKQYEDKFASQQQTDQTKRQENIAGNSSAKPQSSGPAQRERLYPDLHPFMAPSYRPQPLWPGRSTSWRPKCQPMPMIGRSYPSNYGNTFGSPANAQEFDEMLKRNRKIVEEAQEACERLFLKPKAKEEKLKKKIEKAQNRVERLDAKLQRNVPGHGHKKKEKESTNENAGKQGSKDKKMGNKSSERGAVYCRGNQRVDLRKSAEKFQKYFNSMGINCDATFVDDDGKVIWPQPNNRDSVNGEHSQNGAMPLTDALRPPKVNDQRCGIKQRVLEPTQNASEKVQNESIETATIVEQPQRESQVPENGQQEQNQNQGQGLNNGNFEQQLLTGVLTTLGAVQRLSHGALGMLQNANIGQLFNLDPTIHNETQRIGNEIKAGTENLIKIIDETSAQIAREITQNTQNGSGSQTADQLLTNIVGSVHRVISGNVQENSSPASEPIPLGTDIANNATANDAENIAIVPVTNDNGTKESNDEIIPVETDERENQEEKVVEMNDASSICVERSECGFPSELVDNANNLEDREAVNSTLDRTFSVMSIADADNDHEMEPSTEELSYEIDEVLQDGQHDISISAKSSSSSSSSSSNSSFATSQFARSDISSSTKLSSINQSKGETDKDGAEEMVIESDKEDGWMRISRSEYLALCNAYAGAITGNNLNRQQELGEYKAQTLNRQPEVNEGLVAQSITSTPGQNTVVENVPLVQDQARNSMASAPIEEIVVRDEDVCLAGIPMPGIIKAVPHSRDCPIKHKNQAIQNVVDNLVNEMGFDNCNGWLTVLADKYKGNVELILENANEDPLYLARLETSNDGWVITNKMGPSGSQDQLE